MADLYLVNATPTLYDGHAINDGTTYTAYVDASAGHNPFGEPLYADIDFDWGYFVGSQKTSRTFELHIRMLTARTSALEYDTRACELRGWFNTTAGTEQYLVCTFPAAPTTRRLAVRPTAVVFDDIWCRVTLLALSPAWEANSLTTATWTVTGDGQTKTITNGGNVKAIPKVGFQIVTAPETTWTNSKKVLVQNNVTNSLTNYPLEITGGGWDTAALVKNVAKTTAINDGADITAADAIITVDATTDFYTTGLIYIETEQIYYASKDATHFLNCVRGVNGTTAASHVDDTDVYQSECAADGRDIRVELDGGEIPRWFGAAAGAETGPNDDGTLIWVVIPNLTAKRTDGDYSLSGDLTLYTDEYALGADTTVSSSSAGHDGAMAVNGNTADGWSTPAGVVTGNIVVDLGDNYLVNRMMILHPNTNQAIKTYTVQTSTNNVDYTTKATVAANSTKGGYTTHDFADTAARFVKIDITAVQGTSASDFITINEIEIYNVQSRLNIKYGNPLAPAVSQSDDTKPIFELNTSTNSSWDYNDFYDSTKPNRAGQWRKGGFNGNIIAALLDNDTVAGSYGCMGTYQTTENGGDANPATVIGATKYTASPLVSPYYMNDGWGIEHPCGISQVVYSGGTKQDPDLRRWTLGVARSFWGLGTTDDDEIDTDTASAFAAYGPRTKNYTTAVTRVAFYLKYKTTSSATYLGETSDATLAIATPPTVAMASTVANVYCQFSLYNQTNGQRLQVGGLLPIETWVDIDCQNWTVKERATGFNRLAMVESYLQLAIREHWIELDPGTNVLVYEDDTVVEMDFEIMYREAVL